MPMFEQVRLKIISRRCSNSAVVKFGWSFDEDDKSWGEDITEYYYIWSLLIIPLFKNRTLQIMFLYDCKHFAFHYKDRDGKRKTNRDKRRISICFHFDSNCNCWWFKHELVQFIIGTRKIMTFDKWVFIDCDIFGKYNFVECREFNWTKAGFLV